MARTNHRQSVAEHSYYVVLYSMELSALFSLNLEESLRLLRMATVHDLPESFYGDPPGQFKRQVVDSERLRQFEDAGLKRRFDNEIVALYDAYMAEKTTGSRAVKLIEVADLLDQVLYLASEEQMGNGAVRGMFDRAQARLHKAWHSLPFNLVVWDDQSYTLSELWRDLIMPAIRAQLSEQSELLSEAPAT